MTGRAAPASPADGAGSVYTAPMLERWTRAVVRQRVIVIVLWALVVAVGVLSTVRLPGLLSTSLTVPGTGSEQANTVLTKRFGENIEGTFTVVFREANVSASMVRTLDHRFALAAKGVPTGRASALQRGDGILYGNVASSLDLQQAAAYTSALRSALTKAGIPRAYVTGAPRSSTTCTRSWLPTCTWGS